MHGSVFRPVVVYGGTSVGHQLAQVERGANIVVGTPGRLIDFLRRGKVGGWMCVCVCVCVCVWVGGWVGGCGCGCGCG